MAQLKAPEAGSYIASWQLARSHSARIRKMLKLLTSYVWHLRGEPIRIDDSPEPERHPALRRARSKRPSPGANPDAEASWAGFFCCEQVMIWEFSYGLEGHPTMVKLQTKNFGYFAWPLLSRDPCFARKALGASRARGRFDNVHIKCVVCVSILKSLLI